VKSLAHGLLCLLAASLGAATDEPSPPTTLPFIYEEIGGKFLLRLDNRRYQLASTHKDSVAHLLADANYPQAKLCHEDYKRALTEKAAALASLARYDASAKRLGTVVERARQSLESARNQLSLYLSLYRSYPTYDPSQVLFLQEQVNRATSQLATAEDQENRARQKTEEVRQASEPAQERAEKARQAYQAALTSYEKTLASLRALALSAGTAL
jgi:DNA repair ATPase RecN